MEYSLYMNFYLEIWNYSLTLTILDIYMSDNFPQFLLAISISRAEDSVDSDQLASENLNPVHVTIKLNQILRFLEAVHCPLS